MQEKLLPPDEMPTKTCPDCHGAKKQAECQDGEMTYYDCYTCKGEGEIIEEDIRYSFNELRADDERSSGNE